MRSEQQMLDLILDTARKDERVRAVFMNGSRVNPNAPKDFFRDYDVVYIVTEKESYLADPGWIKVFGERMILQLPDEMSGPPPQEKDMYGYLMQFTDGNRIDLNLYPVNKLDKLHKDSLTLALLDKDGILPDYPPPNDSSYIPKPPTAKAFDDCTNEFWWVSPYAAKGLWRREIVYARHMLNVYVREQLVKMMDWYLGMGTNFQKSHGEKGKFLQKFLEPELWQLLLKTYADADYEHTWQALFTMGELFRKMAIPVAHHFGYTYPLGDDERVSAHLRRIRSLPPGAKEMYDGAGNQLKMRTEGEMLELIVNTAREDSRVRAVIMNGSRVNPTAPSDVFQDYDMIYIVTDVESIKADPGWVDVFGERMIMQLPDDMLDPPPDEDNFGYYTYLMQFADGNRIDLCLFPLGKLDRLWKDSLTRVLLDKDGILPVYPPPNDSDYLAKPPTAKAYFNCTNEFWWLSPYVAKGLWRGEIVYARLMLDQHMREQLVKMLTWHVGMRTNFQKSPGKMGKYFEAYLEPDLWQMLLRTYSDADIDHSWEALLSMAELFRRTAIPVAKHFGYKYPHEDDERVSAHLHHVRHLPHDASEMY